MKTIIKSILSVFAIVLFTTANYAQTGIGTSSPDGSAKLDISSNSKGLLVPRMTSAERTNISVPATGLIVYQTDGTAGFYYNAGTTVSPNWVILLNGTSPLAASNITGTVPIAVGGTGTTNGSITGTSALTFTAGGTNQNVSLTPSGTGNTVLAGNVGIGTSSPTVKLEIKAGTSTNTSGLKFSNLNSSSPVSNGATLGVDVGGNVVTVNGASFSPSFGSAAPGSTITVSSGGNAKLASIDFPSTGTYLITYTMRVQPLASNTTGQYAVGYLSLTDTDSPISGTEILGAYAYLGGTTTAVTVASGGNYSGSHIITVTSIPTSLHFRARAFSGAMSFYDNDAGRTKISYVKVTP